MSNTSQNSSKPILGNYTDSVNGKITHYFAFIDSDGYLVIEVVNNNKNDKENNNV